MMGEWTLSRVAACTGGELTHFDVSFARVVTDSRRPCEDALFVALQGPRFDGHDHVADAARNGAVAALVSRSVSDLPAVRVPDTLRALQELGRANRRAFKGPVMALTGSMGKTTVKEMLRWMLGARTCATEGNLNNHVGVPLSLMSLNATHQYGVFELGANHVGEIAQSVSWVQPDVALVTVVGRAHIGEFGGAEAVLNAKSEIFSGLKAGGVAILPAGQPYTDMLRSRVPAGSSVITFAVDAEADLRAEVTAMDGEGCCQARFWFRNQEIGCIRLSMPGRHSVYNAAAALAAVSALGLDARALLPGLETFTGSQGRLNIRRVGPVSVIDDSYNANPDAMKAALDVLVARHEPTKLAVLGAMAELGREHEALHREVLDHARRLNVDVVTVGDWPESEEVIAHFETSDAAGDWLARRMVKGEMAHAILVKGSRSMEMEKIVYALEQKGSPD